MRASELYPAVADVAPLLPSVFEVFSDNSPSRSVGALWGRLKPTTRITWCHAACLPGEYCLLPWSALWRTDQTALYCALGNMIDFFQEAGA